MRDCRAEGCPHPALVSGDYCGQHTVYRLLYVIGVPGCGKTTLVRSLVLGRRRRVMAKPFAFTTYEDGLVQLGRDRLGHGGTDALSMSVQPSVVAALGARVWQRVLGEGDRLANLAFFEAARDVGYSVDVLHLRVPPEVAAARRAERGTTQDEKWLTGRESKVRNLAERVALTPGMTLIPLDGTGPVEALAHELRNHPVVRRS
jgi:hypothetical protein